MRRALSGGALAVVAGAIVACQEPAGPALTGTPDPILTASWTWAPVTPGGSFKIMALQAAGGRIIGKGSEYRLCCFYDSLTVSGQYQYEGTAPSLSLSIRYYRGPTATYVARAMGDSLWGTWTSTSPPASFSQTFFRVAVDPPSAFAP